MNQGAPTRRPLLPVVIGFALAGLFILVLGFWAPRFKHAAPTIALWSPTRDTLVDGPVLVQFETSLPLRLQRTGWGNGNYHVHALLDSVEFMPGAADLRAIGPNRYAWVLPPVTRASRLRLVWALPNHARIAGGSSTTVRIAPRVMSPELSRVPNR